MDEETNDSRKESEGAGSKDCVAGDGYHRSDCRQKNHSCS